MGLDARIEKSSEIIIYRIIQELLNNIMKHAAATEAMVQLIKEEGRLSIIVEDNGIVHIVPPFHQSLNV